MKEIAMRFDLLVCFVVVFALGFLLGDWRRKKRERRRRMNAVAPRSAIDTFPTMQDRLNFAAMAEPEFGVTPETPLGRPFVKRP